MSKKKEWWEKLEKIEFVPEKGKQIRLRAGVRYWLVNDEWIAQARLKERERVVEEIKKIDKEIEGNIVDWCWGRGDDAIAILDIVESLQKSLAVLIAQLKTKK